MDHLEQSGISAHSVVVADDENLDLARSRGFEVVERDNRWLGRKFNDGIEFALSHGATWIVPMGSDSWIDPAYFDGLSDERALTGRQYAIVEADRMLEVSVDLVGPHVIPRRFFEQSGPRPAREQLRRGFDRSLLDAIHPVEWQQVDLHALQYIGFRGERHITTYAKVRQALGGTERSDPWEVLAERYPIGLVNRAEEALATVRPPLAIGRWDVWSVRDRLLGMLDKLRP